MSKRNEPASEAASPAEESFLSHLVELRDRLLRMVLAVTVLFLLMVPFAQQIYTTLAGPLLALLPEGTNMIWTQVPAPFLVPFKLTLIAAVFVAAPYLFYQIWAFVAPGLYRHEKRLAVPLLVSSIVLFYCGIAFAYYVVFPLVFNFFIMITPEGVAPAPDIGQYLNFVIAVFFAFGLAFEVPIATILIVATGAISADELARKRPYVIVGAFIVGMLLTPPDVISQVMLALPMWILFEVGIILSKILVRPRAAEETGRSMSEFDDPNEADAELDRIEAEEEALRKGKGS